MQLAPLPATVARDKLVSLLEFALLARVQAMPFMPKAALKFLQGKDEAKGVRDARDSWQHERFGEGRDPWVATALRGAAPFLDDDATESFKGLSRFIFAKMPGLDVAADAEAADG